MMGSRTELVGRIMELERQVANMNAEILELSATIMSLKKLLAGVDIKRPLEPPILYGADIAYAGDVDGIETDEQTFTRLVHKMGGVTG